ncbi:MAG: metal-dependent hydrolase [Marinobacterium sp.]|nr:metal-dependent hydrolase [Marinobacterium sp.]
MADFHTHIGVAAAGSALLASTLLAAEAISPGQAIVLWALGAGAGLLPDIDSDSSRSIRWIFNGLGVLAALSVLLNFYKGFPIYIIWAAMGFTFLAIRYGAMPLFAAWTIHRGIFHSLLVLPFYALCTVLIADHIFLLEPWLSWLAGIFVIFGAFIHLLLDELYAVDLEGVRLKSSFGTALKPFSFNNLPVSVAMLVLVMSLASIVPPVEPFLAFIDGVRWHQMLSMAIL